MADTEQLPSYAADIADAATQPGFGLGLAPQPHWAIGPTWQKTVDGAWHLPDKNRTLGDQVVNWIFDNVIQPSGPRSGQPFLPTAEQFRFLLWWYAIDENGRFIYRSGLFRRMKGWGKDPLVAAMSLAELCGPVAFAGWNEDGSPKAVRRSSAWIQVAAVSQDQTTNTFRLFPPMISPKMKQEFGLDINKTIIYTNDGCLIEGLTSSPTAMEGKRPTFVIMNEVQWWVETNQGHEMAGVIDGNVTKAAYGGCRSLAICNAHVPGQESVGEWFYDEWHAVQSGQAIDTGVLYDALEAPADTPIADIPAYPKYDDPNYEELLAAHEAGLDALRRGIEIARGDSVWLDVETIVSSILDIKNPISESRRKFLNHVNAAEDSWVSPQEWDLCFDPDLRPLQPGDKITMGFDGSKSNDHTALVACRVEDGALFVIKTWDPAKYGGEVPREDVDTWVDICFARYNPVAFRADVKEFESYVDAWSRKYKKKMVVNASPNNPVAFDMRGNQKRFALDCEKTYDAIVEQEVKHDGNKLLRAHVCNAHRHPTNYDAIAIRKASKDSSRKIDAAVCAVLAWGARQDVLMSKKNRTGRGAVLSAR